MKKRIFALLLSKMKKAAAIFILFFYLLSTNGIAITINYCCGKVSSISLSPAKDKPCKQLKKMPNCCGHKQVYAKLNIQTLTSSSHQVTNTVTAIPIVYNNKPMVPLLANSTKSVFVNMPSPPGKRHAYLLFCSILV